MDLNINPELQKIRCGGLIYEYCHSLPDIIINQDNSEEYLNYMKAIYGIAISSNLMLLFAEICTLVGEDTRESIKEYFLDSLAVVGYAVHQSSELIAKLEGNKDNLILDGQSYCFIVKFLAEIFSYYCGFLNHLKMIKYTTSGMIVKSGSMEHDIPVGHMQSTLAFLLSEEFETLREKFKVIECYKLAFNTRTLH
jgi:hypothetical protein